MLATGGHMKNVLIPSNFILETKDLREEKKEKNRSMWAEV